MNTKQIASNSLHPPVIAGASTGGESWGFFDTMEIHFEPEYETRVFVNSNNTITITQKDYVCEDDPMIVFASKQRAIEVAKAIIHLAKSASFEANSEERGGI